MVGIAMTYKMNKELIEECFKKIISEGMGLDLNEPNLINTPHRVAKMYVDEIFSGLNPENEPKVTVFPNDDNIDQIVQSDTLKFSSTCSHHFVPFVGLAWILYVPDKKVVGASKFSRILNYFARRPQTQERMTKQVADYIMEKTQPRGCMVFTRAVHQCMTCRGINQQNSAGLTTS